MIELSELEQLFETLKGRSVAVVGDFFLDRYLDVDTTLTELSLETGLEAYQVVRVRAYAGAAGTVVNNLSALGVGLILPVTFVGEDAEGWELLRALDQLPGVDCRLVLTTSERRTPTYVKPLVIHEAPPRELNRFDVKNRSATPPVVVRELARRLDKAFEADVVVAVDQVDEPNAGVLTVPLRERLCELAVRCATKTVLAESRRRLGEFHHVTLHGNVREALDALGQAAEGRELPEWSDEELRSLADSLARHGGRGAICTAGSRGLVVSAQEGSWWIPAVRVSGPIDPVGAGDSVLAAVAAACSAGWSLRQAAELGVLAAAITIQKLGETGTASPSEILNLAASCGSQ
jgi:bifunctional ADP-heptose synthase (sugar kinase/adenylyltransferase)